MSPRPPWRRKAGNEPVLVVPSGLPSVPSCTSGSSAPGACPPARAALSVQRTRQQPVSTQHCSARTGLSSKLPGRLV